MRRNTSVLLVICGLCGLTFAVSIGLLFHSRHQANQAHKSLYQLQEHLNALTKAAFLYAEFHKERLPDAEKWPEQLTPYLELNFRGHTDRIAMNRALSERKMDQLPDPINAVLFFESVQGPAADVDAVPTHTPVGMFAVSFADGHGYPRSFSERARVIERSKDATQ